MPRVGFELTIPVFDQAKTVHALDRAATVINIIVLFFSIALQPLWTLAAISVS
jgi:hypothetical protein